MADLFLSYYQGLVVSPVSPVAPNLSQIRVSAGKIKCNQTGWKTDEVYVLDADTLLDYQPNFTSYPRIDIVVAEPTTDKNSSSQFKTRIRLIKGSENIASPGINPIEAGQAFLGVVLVPGNSSSIRDFIPAVRSFNKTPTATVVIEDPLVYFDKLLSTLEYWRPGRIYFEGQTFKINQDIGISLRTHISKEFYNDYNLKYIKLLGGGTQNIYNSTGGETHPSLPENSVQYNKNDEFKGETNFLYDEVTHTLTLKGRLVLDFVSGSSGYDTPLTGNKVAIYVKKIGESPEQQVQLVGLDPAGNNFIINEYLQ